MQSIFSSIRPSISHIAPTARLFHLVVRKEWRTLAVGGLAASQDTGNGNDESADENQAHDSATPVSVYTKRFILEYSQCKDPLQFNQLHAELSNCQTSRQECRSKSKSIVFEDDQEEPSVDGNAPDGNVGENTARKVVAMNHDGSTPKDGKEGPGQGEGDDGEVDEAWAGWDTDIERGALEEVEDEENLGEDEMGAGPEEDPGELEEVEAVKLVFAARLRDHGKLTG